MTTAENKNITVKKVFFIRYGYRRKCLLSERVTDLIDLHLETRGIVLPDIADTYLTDHI